MPLSLISIHRRVSGYEVRDDFRFSSGSGAWVRVCQACGATDRDTLTPVDMPTDNEEDAVMCGATLCEACGLGGRIDEGWAALTFGDVSRLWASVRHEQAREAANKAARERAVATCLEEIQAAFRACEQAIRDERVNDARKVA